MDRYEGKFLTEELLVWSSAGYLPLATQPRAQQNGTFTKGYEGLDVFLHMFNRCGCGMVTKEGHLDAVVGKRLKGVESCCSAWGAEALVNFYLYLVTMPMLTPGVSEEMSVE